ncbi:MAG TPA: TylF/MycF/NovP-related O-methyltransferase [Candidatus Andersenbacteria bacterium]|nr:TylF/MycF/NovP-related O-methyltransferase [Candidatus Andersenbacteria bacterium]
MKHKNRNPQLEMTYKPEDLNPAYYEKAKLSQDRELEHQIGRLINFKNILNECESIEGDIVEFGTYRGFSLLWIAYLLERKGIFSKQIIGFDSFEGLPYDDGSFRKHAFSNTSYKQCQDNIMGSKQLYPATKKTISIGKYRFNNIEGVHAYLTKRAIKQFCFIHIDCDVSQSFLEAMDLMKKLDLIAPTAYILFDDYGCTSNLAQTVEQAFSEMREQWDITTHSSTRFTKNFKLTRK